MKELIEIDKSIFKFINGSLSNDFFDFLMPWLRNSTMWVPFYLFLIVFITLNAKKNGWYWVLGCILTAVLANFISSDLIKGNIWRLRPCNDPTMQQGINILVGHVPQNSSFTSSHATNHMAVSTFIFLTLKPFFKPWLATIFLWGIGIGFAQIYVGVHFPGDILAGSLLGLFLGYCLAKASNRFFCISLH